MFKVRVRIYPNGKYPKTHKQAHQTRTQAGKICNTACEGGHERDEDHDGEEGRGGDAGESMHAREGMRARMDVLGRENMGRGRA